MPGLQVLTRTGITGRSFVMLAAVVATCLRAWLGAIASHALILPTIGRALPVIEPGTALRLMMLSAEVAELLKPAERTTLSLGSTLLMMAMLEGHVAGTLGSHAWALMSHHAGATLRALRAIEAWAASLLVLLRTEVTELAESTRTALTLSKTSMVTMLEGHVARALRAETAFAARALWWATKARAALSLLAAPFVAVLEGHVARALRAETAFAARALWWATKARAALSLLAAPFVAVLEGHVARALRTETTLTARALWWAKAGAALRTAAPAEVRTSLPLGTRSI